MNNNGVYNGSVQKRESIKDLLTNLAAQFTVVVRGEIALAVQSFQEKMHMLRNGLILIAASLFIGLSAWITLCAAAVLMLTEVMSPTGAALTVGGVMVVSSLLLGYLGYRIIKSLL